MSTLVSEFTGYPEHMAVVNDDIGALEAALAAADGDVNVKHHGDGGHTPLTLAICLHRNNIVEHLIKCGANVNLAAGYGRRPVQYSAKHGNGAIMTMLIKAGADLTVLLSDGDDNLCHFAAENEDSTVLHALLDAGVPHNERTADGDLPIYRAAKNQNEQVFSMLLAAGGIDLDDLTIIAIHAAGNSNEKVLAVLIAAGVDVTKCNFSNRFPIHSAAMNPNVAVVRLLIDAGVDVNAADKHGQTPLFFACLNNPNEQVLDALLAAGAEWRDTPRHSVARAAARNQNEAIMRRVIERGCDVNARDSSGLTPLLIAAQSGTANVVSLLLNAGAEAGVVDTSKQSACLLACENTKVGVMRALIAGGASFDVDVLRKAIQMSNLDAVRALIDAGMDVASQFDMNLWSNWSQITGEMLEFLIRVGVNFRARNDHGQTLCDFASSTCLAVLFARGADFTVADNAGRTPLMKVHGDRLSTLLAAGIDPSSMPLYGVQRSDRSFLAVAGHPSVAIDSIPRRQVAWARNRIAEGQFELLRLRAFQVCVGLQSAELPALVSCEILAHAFAPLESLVAFHRVWAIVTIIKHFRD